MDYRTLNLMPASIREHVAAIVAEEEAAGDFHTDVYYNVDRQEAIIILDGMDGYVAAVNAQGVSSTDPLDIGWKPGIPA